MFQKNENNVKKTYNESGKRVFLEGNPGHPKGSINKRT